MGLLDQLGNLNPEQSQGLLAAAAAMLQQSGPSLRPTSFGQVLGGGLTAYQGASDAARQRKLEEDQARQMAQMRGLQMQGLQGGLADQQRARDEADRLRQFYTGQRTGGADGGAQVTPMPGGQPAASMLGAQLGGDMSAPAAPQPQAAANGPGPFEQRMALAKALRAAGFHEQADAQEAQALKFKPKYSASPQKMTGADGKLGMYQLSEDGSPPLALSQGAAPDMTEVDLGGMKQFVDKNRVTDGQTFAKTQSPDPLASNGLGYARLNYEKSQASDNQDAVMDPLAVRMTAQQYLAGDTSALQNFGRGAQGAKNLNAVRLEIAKQANAAGLNGADIAAKVAEFGGLKAGQRTAGTRSANIEIAANEVAQLAPIALDASSKVVRSGFLPFGKAQIMFDSNTNDPNMRQFAMANTALVNAYGQAMARGGSATVSDKDHARELLSTAFDQPSYAAAVAQLQRETRAAQAAPKQVRKDLSDSVAGRDVQPATPAAPTMAAMPTANGSNKGRVLVDHQTGKRYQSNGMQWKEVD